MEFRCERVTLVATLDEAPGERGLLIVSGGNEIRVGAHRGMAKLAAAVANAGHPVFRFDRRGVGDSAGENGGFHSSGPDIAAAIAAFREAAPRLTHITGFGNCDAATALAIHGGVEALILSNPWVVEPVDDLPPPAAIRDRYARRMRDPAAWAALLTGKVDLRAVAKGLGRIASPVETGPLIELFANGLTRHGVPATILLAARDNTAIAFADAWQGAVLDQVRDRAKLVRIDSASHSYADDGDFDALLTAVLSALA